DQALDRTTPLRVCHPVYSPWRVFPVYYLAGIPDYHRTLIWPWLGTLCAVSKARQGDREGAFADLARIGGWYLRYNAVNEVYDAEANTPARVRSPAMTPTQPTIGLRAAVSMTAHPAMSSAAPTNPLPSTWAPPAAAWRASQAWPAPT